MNRTTRRLKALLTAVAFGACCAYAQIAPSAGFVLPDADPDAAPYDFHMSKTDDGMSVLLALNRIDRTVTDSVAGKCRVSVSGLSSTTFAGLPALPYKAFRIAPEGSGTPQIIVRDSTYIDIPVNLDHNPRIEYDSVGQPRQIAVARVDYTGFMPSDLARVTDTQTYRDRPIYTITVMPMKYDRATGVLRIFTSLDIDIAYTVQAQIQSAAGVTRSAAFNAYTDRVLTETLGEQAVAFSTDRQVATMGVIDVPIGDKEPVTEIDLYDTTEDMLVISYKTPKTSFTAATDSLKEWKKNLGYRVHVVERGDWTQVRVDSTIRHHYLFDKNLTTVLIIGTDAFVPGYSIQDRYPKKDWRGIYDSTTDFPYMCQSGRNDSTLFPDFAYGRICATSAGQANQAIAKTIKYEKGLYSTPSVYNKAFLATKYWTDQHNGRFIPTLEDVRYILEKNGVDVQRIYTADEGNAPIYWAYSYPSTSRSKMPSYLQYPQYPWNATKQDIINAFESGVNLAIYNGHGGCDSWGGFGFNDGDCRQLSFTHSAPLIMSIACSTANHFHYLNCLTAELSRNTSGGIAVIASSNITYLGFSDALLLGMIDAIYPNTYTYKGWTDPIPRMPTHKLYDILNKGQLRIEQEQGGGYWDTPFFGNNPSFVAYQRESFHVYGDPTVNYNTLVPTPFSGITYSTALDQLSVSIPNDNLPAKIVVKNLRTGAFVTHAVSQASIAAEYKFTISKTDSVEMIVSAANKIPYREIITSHLPLPRPAASITNVSYDRTTQTAVVSYTLNIVGKIPSFSVTDINNNSYTPLTAIGPGTNQRTIYLDSVPNGLCVISLLIDGKVESTYKLLKQ